MEGSVSPGLEEAIAQLRAEAHPVVRAVRERGMRALLAHLGKPLSAIRADDVASFKQAMRRAEGDSRAARVRIKRMIEGARALLRLMACRGVIEEDEALFFAISPSLQRGIIASTFGDSPRARIAKDAAAFEAALESKGVGVARRMRYQRAVVKLHFFLARVGKTVEDLSLEEWLRFEDEVRAAGGRISLDLLVGARTYLRHKGVADRLAQGGDYWLPNIRALAQLSSESRERLRVFRENLSGLEESARHAYFFGARELLSFLERRGKTVAQVAAGDWTAFEQDVRARCERGEIGRSSVAPGLVGARRFLCEHGREIPAELLLMVASVETREAVAVAVDPAQAELVREVEAFVKARETVGYTNSSNMRQGVWTLLRFLSARGRRVEDMTRQDWDDFRRQANAGTNFSSAAPLVAGASVYLRAKERQGAIAKSPVPPRPVVRATPPALPEGLAAALGALDEGLVAHDFADNTKVNYRRAVWDLLAWVVETHGVKHVSEIRREWLTAYRLRLQTEPGVRGALLSLHTQIGILCALRFFFSWLVKTGWMLSDPTRHLPYPRSPQYLPRSLKVIDVSRLLRSLPKTPVGLRDRAIVELLWGTGMRRGELARLKLNDVDFDARQILIREGKGRKDRYVPLGSKAKETLLDYLDNGRGKLLRGTDDGSVFIGHGGVPLGKNGLTDRVRELGQRIRLKATPHMLRHSCATHLLKGRADIRHIQKLLGHRSLQSTERYTKVEITDLRGVIRRCHPREKDK
jgi:integrase/recombinase XerD